MEREFHVVRNVELKLTVSPKCTDRFSCNVGVMGSCKGERVMAKAKKKAKKTAKKKR